MTLYLETRFWKYLLDGGEPAQDGGKRVDKETTTHSRDRDGSTSGVIDTIHGPDGYVIPLSVVSDRFILKKEKNILQVNHLLRTSNIYLEDNKEP